MSLYLHELTNQRVKVLSEYKPDPDKFSVILQNKTKVTETFSENSVIHAGKPVMWFTSIVGCQYFVYQNNTIKPFTIRSLLYSAVVAILYLLGLTLGRPITYQKSKDLPLDVFGILIGVCKIVVSIMQFSMTAFCRPYYVSLFEIVNDLDRHFGLTRVYYRRLRWFSILLTVVPLILILIQGTHYMRRNSKGEFTYFRPKYLTTPMLLVFVAAHTAGTFYTIINLYRHLVMLNILTESKAKIRILSNRKKGDTFRLKPSFGSRKWSRLAIFNNLENELHGHYCWLELMQIYDKIADCFFLFNKIYSSQVFVMLVQLLILTLSTICRNMSPHLSTRSLLLRDLYVYSLWLARPLALAIISDLIVKQRRKTIDLLHQVMLHGYLDEQHFDQVNTMLNLVQSRPLALTAGVIDLSLRMMLHTALRMISFVILFMQYFYLNNGST